MTSAAFPSPRRRVGRRVTSRRVGRSVIVAVAVADAVLAITVRAQQPGLPPGLIVECSGTDNPAEATCRTDVATYVGWRVYGEHCAACHARDALGSDFAPSLVHRIRRFDRQGFYRLLDSGYLGLDSELGPWGQNPDVARYYAELWSYLSARASGLLPPADLRPLREPAAGPEKAAEGRAAQ